MQLVSTSNASVNVVIMLRDCAGQTTTVIAGQWGGMDQWLFMWAGSSNAVGSNPRRDDL